MYERVEAMLISDTRRCGWASLQGVAVTTLDNNKAMLQKVQLYILIRASLDQSTRRPINHNAESTEDYLHLQLCVTKRTAILEPRFITGAPPHAT